MKIANNGSFIHQELVIRNSRVDSDASISFDPLEERLHPGEGCVHPDLTAEAGAEAGDADLSVFAVLVEILQRTTGVSLQL